MLDGLPGTFTYQWKRYAANGSYLRGEHRHELEHVHADRE